MPLKTSCLGSSRKMTSFLSSFLDYEGRIWIGKVRQGVSLFFFCKACVDCAYMGCTSAFC